MKTYSFPKNFIWGTATSAHQTEGNNKNTDWWLFENNKKKNQEYPLEPSGIACDSYNRYKEDFDLAKKLNNNAIRISIEWARIEPEEGVFSEKEFKHYKEVLLYAKKLKLKTFVTLHHFTNPIWFFNEGGWLNLKSPFYFKRYAKECAIMLGDVVDMFITINEPQVYSTMAYTTGIWTPNKSNPILSLVVIINFIRSHIEAYNAIKSKRKSYQVGIVENIAHNQSDSNIIDKLAASILYFVNCDLFIWILRRHLDFIGVNYYFTNNVKRLKRKNPNNLVSDLGWWIHPQGLENVLLRLRKFGLSIYVTENGIADSKDLKRKEFVKDMLISCHNAIKQGVMLKGYFYWSLIDNFEWHHGFWPRFGLIEIDRNDNLKRRPRKSYFYYKKIALNNSFSVR